MFKFNMDVNDYTNVFNEPFEMDELNKTIKVTKDLKAVWFDGIMTGQLSPNIRQRWQ